ncbi:conserved hypothetical protein [Neospora caninum Liverpool]|uniref:Transmembrane protein n=1 Tax=Neospora caninum (strain Liverpool) TaxID=572307 RepID=F0VAP8_NEOCL|nr:conserved hypothetical protein [Neospora caninum Liverpool]CBZ51306.1 conserved hypothetical protein [Neospora caninum Liverpool]CEL68620.1 TPA: hypothetical protein BN1204_043720 [Neospora caninum Liverpool]|eukprot:XP_003881339.1 conserved hypothetical protein [Neospora caninum Liverpool]
MAAAKVALLKELEETGATLTDPEDGASDQDESPTVPIRRQRSRQRLHKWEDLKTVWNPVSVTSIRPRRAKRHGRREWLVGAAYTLSLLMMAATIALMLRARQQPRHVELIRGRRLVREVRSAFAESSDIRAVQVMAQGAESLAQLYEHLQARTPERKTLVAVETYLNIALNVRKIVDMERNLKLIQFEMTQFLERESRELLTSLQFGKEPEHAQRDTETRLESDYGLNDPRQSPQYVHWRDRADKLLDELTGLYAKNAELYTHMNAELSRYAPHRAQKYLELQSVLSVGGVDIATTAQEVLRSTGYLPLFRGTEELQADFAKATDRERQRTTWQNLFVRGSKPASELTISTEVSRLARQVDRLMAMQRRSARIQKEVGLPGVLRGWWLVNVPGNIVGHELKLASETHLALLQKDKEKKTERS